MYTLTEQWHLNRGLPLENEMGDADWEAIQAMSDAEVAAELRASGVTPEAVAPMLLAKVSARLGHNDLPYIRRVAELLAGGLPAQQDAAKWAGETLLAMCDRLEKAEREP